MKLFLGPLVQWAAFGDARYLFVLPFGVRGFLSSQRGDCGHMFCWNLLLRRCDSLATFAPSACGKYTWQGFVEGVVRSCSI